MTVSPRRPVRIPFFSHYFPPEGERPGAAHLRPLHALGRCYGASKAMGEALARLAYADVVILRVASLFGTAGAGGRGGNFVETMIRAGREKGALRVVDDQTMSPTATADVARVVLRMLAQGCAPGVWHVVNDGPATWFEFACEIVRLAGLEATVTPCTSEEYPTRAARPRYSVLDNTRVSAAFGAMAPWPQRSPHVLHKEYSLIY